jgi:MerR family transcriptional regulator, copper efflux regulator
MPEDTPIACSLSAGELSDRLAEARALGRSSLVSRGEDGALRFRGDPDTRARLEAIVAAESRCCPFLSFDLREEAGSLVLRIDAPEAALPVARDLADAFTTLAVQQALSPGGGRRR